ncbi:MAG: thioredoxin [Deltaproteobacteria bacterium]|nr:thioredoxin [Deltaproteobacteria bacterium]
MASQNVLTATDAAFESDVLKSNVPVLIDFWAEWCGPCRALGPTIDELADQFAGKVKVMKMNVDENPGVPGKYRIRGIPTLIMFKGGQVVDQLVGAHPKATIAQLIEKTL